MWPHLDKAETMLPLQTPNPLQERRPRVNMANLALSLGASQIRLLRYFGPINRRKGKKLQVDEIAVGVTNTITTTTTAITTIGTMRIEIIIRQESMTKRMMKHIYKRMGTCVEDLVRIQERVHKSTCNRTLNSEKKRAKCNIVL